MNIHVYKTCSDNYVVEITDMGNTKKYAERTSDEVKVIVCDAIDSEWDIDHN